MGGRHTHAHAHSHTRTQRTRGEPTLSWRHPGPFSRKPLNDPRTTPTPPQRPSFSPSVLTRGSRTVTAKGPVRSGLCPSVHPDWTVQGLRSPLSHLAPRLNPTVVKPPGRCVCRSPARLPPRRPEEKDDVGRVARPVPGTAAHSVGAPSVQASGPRTPGPSGPVPPWGRPGPPSRLRRHHRPLEWRPRRRVAPPSRPPAAGGPRPTPTDGRPVEAPRPRREGLAGPTPDVLVGTRAPGTRVAPSPRPPEARSGGVGRETSVESLNEGVPETVSGGSGPGPDRAPRCPVSEVGVGPTPGEGLPVPVLVVPGRREGKVGPGVPFPE